MGKCPFSVICLLTHNFRTFAIYSIYFGEGIDFKVATWIIIAHSKMVAQSLLCFSFLLYLYVTRTRRDTHGNHKYALHEITDLTLVSRSTSRSYRNGCLISSLFCIDRCGLKLLIGVNLQRRLAVCNFASEKRGIQGFLKCLRIRKSDDIFTVFIAKPRNQ